MDWGVVWKQGQTRNSQKLPDHSCPAKVALPKLPESCLKVAQNLPEIRKPIGNLQFFDLSDKFCWEIDRKFIILDISKRYVVGKSTGTILAGFVFELNRMCELKKTTFILFKFAGGGPPNWADGPKGPGTQLVN